MADDQQKKTEVISQSGKFWRNLFIGGMIIASIIILFLISISVQQVSDFFSKQGGILFIGFLSFGLIAAILFIVLKKKETIDDIDVIVAKIAQQEFKNNGIIINPTDRFVEELTSGLLLIQFEEVDDCDGNPPTRKVYCYNKKTQSHFPYSLGTLRDAKARIEKSEFHKHFLRQGEAEQKLKDLQEKMGITIEQG